MNIAPTHGWETPPAHQYHIQTDEGPERYFRYQTDSGQYRKEKRLEDGTVVGTYAWIDADGILRQRDYIADHAGYRILKTKNVFVGHNVNVGDAVKAVKKVPASAGTLVKADRRPVVTVPYDAVGPSTAYVSSSTPSSIPYVSTTVRPYVDIISNGIASSTPIGLVTSTEQPIVDITPNSYNIPHSPLNISDIYVPSTTVSPTTFTTEPNYYYTTAPPSQYIQTPVYDAVQPIYTKEVDQNSLDYNPYVQPQEHGYRFQNGPTYPLDRNGRPYNGQYDSRYQTYDGVSVTNDGFRYYIPRAYHEEQTLPGDKRSGSFGYIDPFGIRRVIYYNTAPGSGFQHRKNNRYVGFDATPYDPRPL